MKMRIKLWAWAIVLALILAWCGSCVPKDIERKQITVNAPQAMHTAFEETLNESKLKDEYEIKFTNSENANFTVTTQKTENSELIAYSPVVAVFNLDEEQYNSYIEQGIFVPSETEADAYDFDFWKIMCDIVENPDSIYKVYYPDSSIGDWNVFYTFLLYTANNECYPSEGANMAETKELVEAFLNSKNTEAISTDSLEKISGYSKNSVYFMSLADLGYICEQKKVPCRVMFTKTVVSYNYYVTFDETGEKLFDVLDDDVNYFIVVDEIKGYSNLRSTGNYFVTQLDPSVSIYQYINGDTHYLELRETYNSVEVADSTQSNKED